MNRLALSSLGIVTLLCGAAAVAQPEKPAPRHGLFDTLDANKDGTITRQEASTVWEKQFAELDTDKNGVISAAERDSARDRERDARFEARFAAMDTDKNGQISRDELKNARKQPGDAGRLGPGGHRGPGPAFAKGDMRGGPAGDIAKADFLARHMKMFDLVDSNDDGKISMAERDAAAAHRGNQMGDRDGKPMGNHERGRDRNRPSG